MSAVIGITFGNTTSSIAIASADGKVDVIANPDGDRSIPSALSYVGHDEYHGTQAVNQLVRNAKNTIVNFRDFIGKKFDDVDTKAPSQVGATPIKTAEGGIAYEIERENGTETVTVEEAATRHFKQLKVAAEDFIGSKIEGVVITVPTNFTAHQKEELIKISNAAGLKVLQLIHEPSASLLAHLSTDESKFLEDKIYAVADFGGIRSDGAVIAVRGGVLTILATEHDTQLGGEQLDAALVEHFAKEFEKKYKANAKATARSVAKLTAESIVVKKTLSNVQTSTCSIESLSEGFDFHTSINRLRFELAARKPLSDMTAFVEKVVTKAGLETLDIDEVLLVGGSSHIPKLGANVSFIFPENTTVVAPSLDSKAVDPAELATRGAALQAALIESFDEEQITESLQPVVVNTNHLSKPIGVKAADGSFVPILVAETAYPIKKSIEVTNGESSNVAIELYEGKRGIKETVVEAPKYSDDEEDEEEYSDEEPEIKREVVYEAGSLLAKLALKDLKPNAKVEVTVNITQNGTLHVSGRELKQGAGVVKGEVVSA